MQKIIASLKQMEQRYFIFLKWFILASLVGLIVGTIGTAFHFAIEKATLLRLSHQHFMYFMPLVGCIIVFLYNISHRSDELNTNLVLECVRSSKQLPLIMAPLIFISTVLTHLVGGSSGREGAALQLGGSLSNYLGERLHLDENDLRILTMCGMSAAFSALFRTPISATIFSMEVISVGVMYYVALVPCIIAAVISYAISGYFGISATHYPLAAIASLNLITLLQVMILGIFCALLSIFFCKTLHKTHSLYHTYFKNPYLRICVGSVVVIFLTRLLNTTDYLGAGMPIIAEALNGHATRLAFLLKVVFTVITLGAGFKGGEIVPSFFIGATFGAIIGPILGLPSSFSASL